ncbi:NACHT%2C LRR and PYD domains-containing protein 12-like [Scomber scombrus]|uniref:NACHT, LRR and PYD domains-containing protein 12-like n=1 Tax=Scomber scombrus TaxID=13677 RepID=A0AAV1QEX6_SCOSC
MVRKEDLLKTLEDLTAEEYEDFKWHLMDVSLEGYQAIKASGLQKAERRVTVDLMVQTYQLPAAVEATKKFLKKINRNDLLQSLSDSGPEATTQRDAGGTTSTVQHGSVINQPQLAAVYVEGSMNANVSNTYATTQRDAGGTTSTVQHGSVTNRPQLAAGYVGGNMNANVSNTYGQPPARDDTG